MFTWRTKHQIQSDRLEREFGIYRQMNGANAFMLVADVLSSFKRQLANFSATYLDTLVVEPSSSTLGNVWVGTYT